MQMEPTSGRRAFKSFREQARLKAEEIGVLAPWLLEYAPAEVKPHCPENIILLLALLMRCCEQYAALLVMRLRRLSAADARWARAPPAPMPWSRRPQARYAHAVTPEPYLRVIS